MVGRWTNLEPVTQKHSLVRPSMNRGVGVGMGALSYKLRVAEGQQRGLASMRAELTLAS